MDINLDIKEVEKVLLKSVSEAFKIAEKLCLEQGVSYGSLFTRKR